MLCFAGLGLRGVLEATTDEKLAYRDQVSDILPVNTFCVPAMFTVNNKIQKIQERARRDTSQSRKAGRDASRMAGRDA